MSPYKTISMSIALALAFLLPLPADASKFSRLGEDPSGDAPPALDVTYLDVARSGKNIEARIGVSGMLPVLGGYPALPGIEWIFKAGKKTFLAEAYVDNDQPAFLLFEILEDSYKEAGELSGTYSADDGFIQIDIPLAKIGARKGTKIKPAPAGDANGDVDAHVHAGATTYYADGLEVTKNYVVP